MSEAEAQNNQEAQEAPVINVNTKTPSILDSLVAKRNQDVEKIKQAKDKEAEKPKESTDKKVDSKAAENPKAKEPKPVKEVAQKESAVATVSEDDEDEVTEALHEKEIKKLKKMVSDSTTWGHSNNKKIKALMKEVNSLFQDQALTQEEYDRLTHLSSSDVSEPEAPEEHETNP